MKNSMFSNLKLRAGWGQTGNQEIDPKITLPSYTATVSSSTSYPLTPTGSYPSGLAYRRLANPDIQWEVSTQTNVGLDFGLFKGRLNGSIDVFSKNTNNILLLVIPQDPIVPASEVWTNVKDMNINNKGLEIDLEYRVNSDKGFRYSIGGNLTLISNKVTHSPYTVLPSGSASGSGPCPAPTAPSSGRRRSSPLTSTAWPASTSSTTVRRAAASPTASSSGRNATGHSHDHERCETRPLARPPA